jgi:hypothetical protein
METDYLSLGIVLFWQMFYIIGSLTVAFIVYRVIDYVMDILRGIMDRGHNCHY